MRPHEPLLHVIDIEPLRIDATRVTRGFFAIAFLPLYLLFMMLLPFLGALPDISHEPFDDPIFWITMVFGLIGYVVVRKFGASIDAMSLKVMLAGAWVLTTLVIAFIVLKAGELDFWHFEEGAAAVLTVVSILLIASLGLMYYWLVAGPCLAALRLLDARIPGSNVTLTEMASRLDDPAAAFGAPPPEALPTTKSRLLKALAVLIALAGAVATLWGFGTEQMFLALFLEFATIAGAAAIWRYGRRYETVDARTLLARDARPPILYLRSFQDDEVAMEQDWDMVGRLAFWRRSGRRRGAVGRLMRQIGRNAHMVGGGRLEEVLAQVVRPMGPFVGIGSPDEPLPQLGAARAYFSNDTWQTAVVRWVDGAQFIVKVAGPTRWIRWELDTILARQAWPRLIIVIPEAEGQDLAMRWANIEAELADTPWRHAFAMVDRASTVAMRLLEGGRIAVVTSDRRNMVDFVMAIRIMIYQMRFSRPR